MIKNYLFLLTLIFLLINERICFSMAMIIGTNAAAGITEITTTGLWVAQRGDKRETGRDAALKMEMRLIDKKGQERKRKLFIIRKDFNGEDKLLLKFTYPNDIKGTSFLVWEHKDKENERFLYLPALGRIRRIATSQKEENFAGTDFSYEDITGRKLEDYTYQLIKENVSYEGKSCYLLASYSKKKQVKFPKILSWVRRDIFVAIKAEYYNKKEKVVKTFKVLNLKKIDDIWTPLELSMENHKTSHKTFIKVTKVQYNKGIPDYRFKRKELKR